MQLKKLKGRSASYILLYLAIVGGVILAGPKLPLVPDGRTFKDLDPTGQPSANSQQLPGGKTPGANQPALNKAPSGSASAGIR